jgi:hypothetical protein
MNEGIERKKQREEAESSKETESLFKPNLNENSLKIASESRIAYSGDVFNNLYRRGEANMLKIESQERKKQIMAKKDSNVKNWTEEFYKNNKKGKDLMENSYDFRNENDFGNRLYLDAFERKKNRTEELEKRYVFLFTQNSI